MLNEKERRIISEVRDGLQSDGSDTGDACYRVDKRKLTELLGEPLRPILLFEKRPFKPMYFPENYPDNYYES